MAGRIQGITIEIDGNTTKLQQSLKGVDSQLKTTKSTLKDVEKLLKFDPGNTELLRQKQKQLESAIKGTKERLEELKNAQSGVEKGSAEWDALQREIIATEQDLKKLEQDYKEFGNVAAQQIKAVGKQMQELGSKIENAGRKLQPMSTAAAGALTALGGVAYKAVTSADDLNTLARQTGFTTEEIQRMQYAADLVDVSFEDISGAAKKMKAKMTEGNATFAALGVSVTNADGSLRNINDVFYESIDALSHIENETERDQVAMELFGKGADSLAGIIDDGGQALKEYGDQAKELGLILDQDTLDSLNAVNDVLDQTKAKAGGSIAKLGATLATTLAPVLDKIVGVIDKVTTALANLTPQQTETILKILAIVAAIGPVLTIGGKIVSMIGMVVSAVGAVVGVLGGPLTIAIAGVIAAGVLIYKNWDKIKEAALKLKDTMVKVWTNIKTTVTNAANTVKTAVSNAWDNIKAKTSSAWDGIRTMLQGKWNSIKSAYEQHGGGLKGAASATMEGIKQYFTLGFDTLNSILGGKLDSLKNIVANGVAKLKSAFNFTWRLPDIKLPHFKVQGGTWPYGLGGKGQLPRISIDWYKRAYENAMMFTSPTVMATPGGLKGFGDGNGAEIVLGLNKLRELVGTSQGIVINVYGTAGQDVNQLADAIQRRLVALQKQREVAYA